MVGVRPLIDRTANNIEIFNESMILIMNYHLFLFHFFEDDPMNSYFTGWLCIGVTGFLMIANVIMVLISVVIKLRFTMRKC